MKPAQHSKGIAEKKPQSSDTPLLSSSVAAGDAAKAQKTFGSPSAAIWSRYIDSRMKQFGTR